jgi:hypothetical protein
VSIIAEEASCQQGASRVRVWSLLDLMRRFDGSGLGHLISSLHALRCRCDEIETAHGKGSAAGEDLLADFRRTLKDVRGLASESQFERSGDAAFHSVQNTKTDNDVTTLKAHLHHVENDLLADLDEQQYLRVLRDHTSFIDNDELFGSRVGKAFSSASQDIREAGNCLAADCNTAAVFHLMRAAEVAMRALARDRDVEFKDKPIEHKEWGQILPNLESKVTELRDRTPADRWADERVRDN